MRKKFIGQIGGLRKAGVGGLRKAGVNLAPTIIGQQWAGDVGAAFTPAFGPLHACVRKFTVLRLAPALLAISLLAMLTVMITACTGGTAAGSGNNPNTVHMSDSNFDQSSITIKKGESLTLVSDTSAVHIIENGTWDNNGTQKPNIEEGAPKVDAQMNGGDSKTFSPFNTAGTFHLYCTVHPGMNLTVIVK